MKEIKSKYTELAINVLQKTLIPKWLKFTKKSKNKSRNIRKSTALMATITGGLYLAIGIAIFVFPSLRIFLFQPSNITIQEVGFISAFLIFSGAFMLAIGYSFLRTLNIAPKGLEVFEKD